ncbi:uncharacterized protein LOC105737287 [Apis florea]|uniref:uncharacterized protein LOC105737287 n=1 Tax=Apis florea TaxID=7463 RepID=UPI0006290ECC|nr:uncharacterized protein LOC105737287 [Apis florea]
MSITNVFDCVGRCVKRRLRLEEELFTLIAGRKAGNVLEVEKGSLVHQKHLFSKVEWISLWTVCSPRELLTFEFTATNASRNIRLHAERPESQKISRNQRLLI